MRPRRREEERCANPIVPVWLMALGFGLRSEVPQAYEQFIHELGLDKGVSHFPKMEKRGIPHTTFEIIRL